MSPGAGIDDFMEGLRLSRHPALRHYVWIPALLSLVIIGGGLYVLLGYLGGLSERWVSQLPEWLTWLSMVLEPLLYLLGLLAGAWGFALLAVLISSPFLGIFSAALEKIRFGRAPDTSSSLWADMTGSLGREARKLFYYLPRLLVVFLITLIPVINVASPVIWFLFGSWTLAIQFVDYPAENRQLPFRATLDVLKANRLPALAFGACATLALMIPLVNFLLIPAAVAGGTLLWHRLDSARSLSQP